MLPPLAPRHPLPAVPHVVVSACVEHESDSDDESSHGPSAHRVAHRRTRSGERGNKKKQQQLATGKAASKPREKEGRGRESRAKRLKRQQYGTLSAADMAALAKLGVTRVGELAPAFRKAVEQVSYLHTRRQHIVDWLAQSELFPLLTWDHEHTDEHGQPTLRLHAKRADVHQALCLLLKCEPTEWLFKRFHHATTAEGRWLFKRGQYRLLLEHAAKAIGRKHVNV